MSKHDASEMEAAHAAIGGFIARCSLLDYRLSQFVARWFGDDEKQKYLSYTLQAIPFAEKRQVIEARLSQWHAAPETLRATMSEIDAVLQRRNLVAKGILSRRSSGALCLKSFSGARFILDEDGTDILDVAELPALSERATNLSERLIALGTGFDGTPTR